MTEAKVAFNFTPCEHKEFPPNCPFCLQASLGLAEDDADRLAVVVANAVALLRDRAPHSSTCTYIRPGVCSCGLFSLTESMGEALRAHEERNAGD